jgi:AraC-like DNA-binding protein
MQAKTTYENHNEIAQMLIQLAMGDFAFRINAENNSLQSRLNFFAEQLQQNSSSKENSTSYFSLIALVNGIIVIDDHHLVKGITPDLAIKLSYSPKKFIGLMINQVIDENSMQLFNHIITSTENQNKVATLSFLTTSNQILSLQCLIAKIIGTNHIIITSITIDWENKIVARDIVQSQHKHPSETEIAQTLYNFIMENLSKPLPPIKVLCRFIGTNQFTIKDSFKKEYKTSIYQFYNQERLKRAHLMIQQTELSLKKIALNNGFNNYTNFFKAFKKKYNYTPSQVLRKL